MPRYRVEYTETRYFTIEIDAENEAYAQEEAMSRADDSDLWRYRNEEFSVSEMETSKSA